MHLRPHGTTRQAAGEELKVRAVYRWVKHGAQYGYLYSDIYVLAILMMMKRMMMKTMTVMVVLA